MFIFPPEFTEKEVNRGNFYRILFCLITFGCNK
jgi:hypothetical protein